MEHLWITLTSPSINFGATLRLWIIFAAAIGIIAVTWRHRCHRIQDRILIAQAHGYAKGLEAGFQAGKQTGLDTVTYQNWIDDGLEEFSLYLESQS